MITSRPRNIISACQKKMVPGFVHTGWKMGDFQRLYSRGGLIIVNIRLPTVKWYQYTRTKSLNTGLSNWPWEGVTYYCIPPDFLHRPWAPWCGPYPSINPTRGKNNWDGQGWYDSRAEFLWYLVLIPLKPYGSWGVPVRPWPYPWVPTW